MTSLKSYVIYVKEIILVGDFNINWDKKEDRTLKPITDNCSLTQFIDKPTRITDRSKTKIDLLFTNRPERINIYNLLTEISDHNTVFFSRKLSKKRFQSSFHYPSINRSMNNTIYNIIIDFCSKYFSTKIVATLATFSKRGRQMRKKKKTIFHD